MCVALLILYGRLRKQEMSRIECLLDNVPRHALAASPFLAAQVSAEKISLAVGADTHPPFSSGVDCFR